MSQEQVQRMASQTEHYKKNTSGYNEQNQPGVQTVLSAEDKKMSVEVIHHFGSWNVPMCSNGVSMMI